MAERLEAVEKTIATWAEDKPWINENDTKSVVDKVSTLALSAGGFKALRVAAWFPSLSLHTQLSCSGDAVDPVRCLCQCAYCGASIAGWGRWVRSIDTCVHTCATVSE